MTTKKLSDLIQEEVKNQSETVSETIVSPTVPDNRTRMTKAQLDELITQLNRALQQEKQQVDTLQNQVNTLEGEIKDERELSSRLQNELQAAENYQSQFNEQKKLVEKLYAQLQQKEELAGELAEKNEIIASLQAKLQEDSPPLSSTDSSQELVVQETALTRQAKELQPFAAPILTSKPLTNDDIGWFD
ncbi:hypothetical protein [Crocosphaera sp. Alani8]|uniref:hypothetical protein n=1 Tax=Crocosphaera sp. Alani8 TaxID=3038952 RepID=UPI00313C8398